MRRKKLMFLFFKDLIIKMHESGMSMEKIANNLNKKRIPASRFNGLSISKTSVFNIIKKYGDKKWKE